MGPRPCSHRVYGPETRIELELNPAPCGGVRGGPRAAPSSGSTSSVTPSMRDHAHLLTGRDGRRPVGAGPPAGRAHADDAVGVDGLDDVAELADHPLPADRRAWRSASAPSRASRRRRRGSCPPMPASSVIHDGRSVTPGRSSNSSRLPSTVSAMPTPVQNRGTPTWTSTAKASIPSTSRATAQPRAGRVARPVHARTRHAAPDDPGDADAGGEELEDQQGHADQQQEVGHGRAGDGVEQLVDEAELGEADGGDRVPAAACRRRGSPRSVVRSVTPSFS